MRPQQTLALLCSHLMEKEGQKSTFAVMNVISAHACKQCCGPCRKQSCACLGLARTPYYRGQSTASNRVVEIASGPRDAVFLPCLQIPSRNLFFKYLDSKSFRDQLHSICPKDRRGKKKQAPTPATGLCLDRRRNWPSLKINFKT